MLRPVHTLKIGREDLPELLAAGGSAVFEQTNLDARDLALSHRQILVGYWDAPDGEPLPDFIISGDEDFDDTAAWLSAFLTGFSPLSQWCRHWRVSDLLEATAVQNRPSLGTRLGAWTGAILAEFSSENPGANLKDTSVAAVLTASTYAIARGVAVWGDYGGFETLLDRSFSINARRREGGRANSRENLLALWYVLAGEKWRAKPIVDARALGAVKEIVEGITSSILVTQDDMVKAAKFLGDHFNLPEIKECALGTQGQRVEALDKLGDKLLDGPKSSATSAIMGFGASLVDPGAAVMPELLRRYTNSIPSAAMWAGAFAGMWYPVRVLSDQGGIGRIVAKELLKASDLFSKPAADISYDELDRWTGGNFLGTLPVRGFMPRTLLVELSPGVMVPFPMARIDSPRSEASSQSRASVQPSFDLEPANQPRAQRTKIADRNNEGDILHRIERLEKLFSDFIQKSKSPRATGRARTDRS